MATASGAYILNIPCASTQFRILQSFSRRRRVQRPREQRSIPMFCLQYRPSADLESSDNVQCLYMSYFFANPLAFFVIDNLDMPEDNFGIPSFRSVIESAEQLPSFERALRKLEKGKGTDDLDASTALKALQDDRHLLGLIDSSRRAFTDFMKGRRVAFGILLELQDVWKEGRKPLVWMLDRLFAGELGKTRGVELCGALKYAFCPSCSAALQSG